MARANARTTRITISAIALLYTLSNRFFFSGSGAAGAHFKRQFAENPHVILALELGGDLNGVDEKGETVMHGAAWKHLPGVVAFLAEAGADINVWNQPNAREWTPLDIVGVHLDLNRQSSPVTAVAIREAMEEAGVTPPPAGN